MIYTSAALSQNRFETYGNRFQKLERLPHSAIGLTPIASRLRFYLAGRLDKGDSLLPSGSRIFRQRMTNAVSEDQRGLTVCLKFGRRRAWTVEF
jgi:hypothetical protein